MGSRRDKPMSARAERQAMIALVAVFALLVQMLAPTLAVAGPASGPGTQVICTSHGLQTIQTGDAAPAQDSPAAACDHCVCPPAAATPAAVVAPAAAVRYAVAAIDVRRANSPVAPGRGLAAPPPPSRGPPSLLT